jgi:hypothetical protein
MKDAQKYGKIMEVCGKTYLFGKKMVGFGFNEASEFEINS